MKSRATSGPRRLLPLDVDREVAIGEAASIIARTWRSFDSYRPGQPPIDPALAAFLHHRLPQRPSPAQEALQVASSILDESVAPTRPRYFAFVGSAGLEIGVVADALAACFDVNLAVWAGAASRIEAQAVSWVAEFVGYPAAGGSFTSGGTISNLTALMAARERAVPGSRFSGLEGIRLAIYCSQEAHYSVIRAAELLGIGRRQVRALGIDEERRLRPELVAEAIDGDRAAGIVPVAVVATAGTTLTGAVDPIAALGAVCAERDVWLHVDGAYGLPAVAVPSARALFEGLERADSVSVDAHKWLYLPKACGVVLVRRPGDLEAALAHEEAYLPHEHGLANAVDHTVEYSRPFRALKMWLAFLVHGAAAFRTAIEADLRLARVLYEEIGRHPDLEGLPKAPTLSVVPFRHRPAGVTDLDAHNQELVRRLQEGGEVWVASATIDGRVYLRPCFVNYRTRDQDVLALVDLVRRVGADVRLAAS